MFTHPKLASVELAVFDLDFTLWNAGDTWCDHLSPPFKMVDGRVLDANGAWIRLYPDVPDILEAFEAANVPLGLASRTHEPTWARQLLEMLGVRSKFAFEQIYPGTKTRHFAALAKDSGATYGSMLFFDDERRNIVEVGDLGVTAVPISSGVSWERVEKGLERF